MSIAKEGNVAIHSADVRHELTNWLPPNPDLAARLIWLPGSDGRHRFAPGFSPQILALSAYRHELPRSKLPGFQERIHVGRASLSWWSPTELWDVEYNAPDGQPFLKIAHVTEGRSAWQSVFRPAEPFEVRLENPVLTLRYRPDGNNIADALAPCAGKPKRQEKEKSIEVTGGEFLATDATTGKSTEWKNVDFQFSRAADPTALNRLHLTAESAGAHTTPGRWKSITTGPAS